MVSKLNTQDHAHISRGNVSDGKAVSNITDKQYVGLINRAALLSVTFADKNMLVSTPRQRESMKTFAHVVLAIITAGIWAMILAILNNRRLDRIEERQHMLTHVVNAQTLQSQAKQSKHTQIRKVS